MLATIGLAPDARSQEILDVLRASQSDEIGLAVSALGDLNHDGFGDFAVGARPGSNSSAPVISVHSGADRSVLYGIPSILGERRFSSMSPAGDVNRDGYVDLIVGFVSHGRVGGSFLGVAVVYSGLNGSQIHSFPGPHPGSQQGYAVDGAGDVDGDGHADVIVGAIRYNSGLPSRATVYSGATGAVLHEFFGSNAQDEFGGAVAGVGDVDHDGFDDLLVGAGAFNAAGVPAAGAIWVYSGRDGSTLLHRGGAAAGQHFGVEVLGIGDVDRDGVPDFVVRDGSVWETPRFTICSGADAGSLFHVSGRDAGFVQGAHADAGGDYDGDGIRDLMVGRSTDLANGVGSGSLTIHSGADGSILLLLDGAEAGTSFGRSAAFVGKLNGDSADDFVIGAPDSQGRVPPYYARAGAVFVVAAGSPHDLLLLAPTVGRKAGHADAIRVQRATPGTTVHLAHSFAGRGTTIITSAQVTLALHGARPLGSAIANAAGVATFPIAVPDRFRGRTIWLQAFAPARVSNWAQRLIYWPWNWE